MTLNKTLRKFLLPSLTPAYILRIIFVAVSAWLLFSYIFIPLRIEGISMEPTYRSSSFNFCWRLRYLFSEPERGDVVVVRLAGKSVMLLKRIVAMEGEEVQFRFGKLLVDDVEMDEPYVQSQCNWNLPPRLVEPGHVYVAGDNRDMPMHQHDFGQVSVKRIMGGPIW